MVCTKKPLLVFIVESRGFFGSANNATCLDNAFVCIQSLHLRIPLRVLHFSAIHWYCKSFDCYLFVQATLAADTSLHCHIISHWPVFDLSVVSANTIIQHQIIQCWSVCNLLQSSTTTPVTPFYSLTSPTYQPYPRATATPTGPIPPHITPHGTPSTPTIPPSPSTPHPPKLKVTVREMVEGI